MYRKNDKQHCFQQHGGTMVGNWSMFKLMPIPACLLVSMHVAVSVSVSVSIVLCMCMCSYPEPADDHCQYISLSRHMTSLQPVVCFLRVLYVTTCVICAYRHMYTSSKHHKPCIFRINIHIPTSTSPSFIHCLVMVTPYFNIHCYCGYIRTNNSIHCNTDCGSD